MRSTADIIFRTNDIEAAKAFYHGVLGFPMILGNAPIVGFDTGDLKLYFEPGEPGDGVYEFEVDDVDGTKEKLLAQGCTLVEYNPEVPRCYLRDRFGVTFNLTKSYTS
jgi:catechol 2,3-dioxygenase-like lactoylglutathione lyase family enzyme